jgi:hypothetical protein
VLLMGLPQESLPNRLDAEWEWQRSNAPNAVEKAANRCVAEHVRAKLAF